MWTGAGPSTVPVHNPSQPEFRMPTPFDALIAAPPSGRSIALVLDHASYGSQRLLRGDPVPWTDPVACAAYFVRAQSLLEPDVALVDLGEAVTQHLAGASSLVKAMSARPRVGFALKALLADEDLAVKLHTLVRVLSQTCRQPLVLQIPTPLRWLAICQVAVANDDLSAIDAERAEGAAVFVSDWLRRFGALPIALLLLDARNTNPILAALPEEDLTCYPPLRNATAHYRWSLALRTEQSVTVAGSAGVGVVLPETFWTDGTPAGRGAFRMATVPFDAQPERVLARLRDLV